MDPNNGFWHFNGPNVALIRDATVKTWLQQCQTKILNGSQHWYISSGDTHVSMRVYSEYVFIVVAQIQGYAKKDVKLAELSETDLTWIRPVSRETVGESHA